MRFGPAPQHASHGNAPSTTADGFEEHALYQTFRSEFDSSKPSIFVAGDEDDKVGCLSRDCAN
jgi:hypothetical protein